MRWLAPSASASAEPDHDSRPRQHDDLARAARRERETLFRRAHAGDCLQQPAEPPDLDPQPRAMGFVGVLRAERAGEQHVPRHVPGPCLAERARKREQHRTPRERHEHVSLAHKIAAGVDDKRLRREQRLDFL